MGTHTKEEYKTTLKAKRMLAKVSAPKYPSKNVMALESIEIILSRVNKAQKNRSN